MKLSTYAKKIGLSYKTVWAWWRRGFLNGQQFPTGTIVIDDADPIKARRPEPRGFACKKARDRKQRSK